MDRDLGDTSRLAAPTMLREPDSVEPVLGPKAGVVRLGRGAVLGAFSLLLATGAHLLGGGTLPGAGTLLVAAVLLGLVAAVVTARRCRFALLLALLGVEQLGLHALFSMASATQACTVTSAAGPPGAGMTHGSAIGVVSACDAASGMHMAGMSGWSMWAAHLAAVAATAWLLARGEAWLWRLAERVAVASGLRHGRRPTRTRRAAVPVHAQLAGYGGRFWADAAPRGPPAPAALRPT